MTRTLVIAAHPDDEILGCGATVARLAAAGEEVMALIVAEGATARTTGPAPPPADDEVRALRHAAQQAAAILGAAPPRFLGLPDNRLDSLPLLDLIKAIEAEIAAFGPQVIYTHHGGDLNIDHRRVHQAVLTACRPLPGAGVRALYAFETASATEWGLTAFEPNRFVDVSAVLGLKIKALEAYKAEMRPFPHARSIEALSALARWRGACAGMEAAEAFSVVRELC